MKNYESVTAYKNDFNKRSYDHINLMLPKGMKEALQEEAKAREMSLNALIVDCIKKCTAIEKTVQICNIEKKPCATRENQD